MSDTLTYLDQALEAGQMELACLRAGEVEEAERLAFDRGRLMEEAWRMRDADKAGLLKEKLLRLQRLQGQLTAEARRLHETLREDLLKAKKENQRFTGYKGAKSPPPLASRFVDKVG